MTNYQNSLDAKLRLSIAKHTMSRLQLAKGRIQFDEEDESYYFTTETGEVFYVPFEKMQTGPGKFIYNVDTGNHQIVTKSGNSFTFTDEGNLWANGLTAEEVYSTVGATKMTVPDSEEVLIPEEHEMIKTAPYNINGALQVDGKLTVL